MPDSDVTIGQLLERVTRRDPEHEALVYLDPPVRLTYGEFDRVCSQVAKGLLHLGVEKGDHVAIWAHNVPEWVVAQFATAKIGAVLTTVNTSYRRHELEYLLRQSDTKHLLLVSGIKGDEYLEMINGLCPELQDCPPGKLRSEKLPLLRNVIFLGQDCPAGMFSWGELLTIGEDISDDELCARREALKPDDVVNMQYTSGTTGFPKGVMLTHRNLIGNARSIAECLAFTHDDRLCIPVPLFHCFGCVLGTLTCVVSGATMVPVVKFDPNKVLETVEQEDCTAVHGVPTMFIAELEELAESEYDTSSLRTGIMAGSPCPIEVMKQVTEVMGADEICITYGLTEASPAITMTRTDDPIERRVSTVGRAIPDVEVKIVDPETGGSVEPGEQGELCTRGYHVMKGYYKMPEETDQAIDEDGWLHTGDLAIMDSEGYCRITGRLKDMIIRGGENIYPREVEEFLYSHPHVRDVEVVGVPSEKYGEEVVAFIQLKPGETSSEAAIKAHCEDEIAWFKIPEFVFFVDEYPKTASGKVQKYKLREDAIQRLGRESAAQAETA